MPGLLSYAQKMLLDEAALVRDLTTPLLIWESLPGEDEEEAWMPTLSGAPRIRPRATEPLVFELRKATEKANPFAMGITVGRADNNDIPLPDGSVSRFHAYFVQGLRGSWSLVDAESRNGTWVGPLRIAKGVPTAISDRTRVRIGMVELLFVKPESFLGDLRKRMKGQPV